MGSLGIFSRMNGCHLITTFCFNKRSFLLPFKRAIFSNSKQIKCIGINYVFSPLNKGCTFLGRVHQFNSIDKRLAMIGTSLQKNTTCWNCSKSIQASTLFCEFCNSIQPVNKGDNFFQILGVKPSFNFDLSDLRNKFRYLQSLLHPDKFTSNSKKEQELSEEFSSVVNKAYSTLSNPLERGLYLLSLHGMSIEEGNTDVDKVFLMEIMERNEEIENETDPNRLKEFNIANREQLHLLTTKVTEAFESNDLELAKKLLTEMKYYNSIDTKIKDIKQKYNIPD